MSTTRLETEATRAETLPGGLVLLTERLPWVRSVALALAFEVGSRDDPDDAAGSCHMIEHMVFKGTEQYDAIAVNARAEFHGAELNAFTDRESTVFTGRFPASARRPMSELLVELVTGPAFRPDELERERGVISEEIRAAEEEPEARSLTLLYQALWDSSPLGRPVAGTLQSVAAIRPDALTGFYRQRFTAPNCIVAAAGDIDHDELRSVISPLVHRPTSTDSTSADPAPVRTPAGSLPPRVLAESRRELTQAWVCLGTPTFGRSDERRWALAILNTALGGGVSSRLFARLREQEGLVYAVSSFIELLSDTGLAGIFFAADSRRLARCVAVIAEELERCRRQGFSQEEFERARNMTRSSVLLTLESTAARSMRLYRTWQLHQRLATIDETLAGFDRLTLDQVNELAAELLVRERFSAGGVGPLPENEFCRILSPAC